MRRVGARTSRVTIRPRLRSSVQAARSASLTTASANRAERVTLGAKRVPFPRLHVVEVERARERLLALFDENGGVLSAAIVEQDDDLMQDTATVSAAAHALATEPDIITGNESDEQAWFPYSFMMRVDAPKGRPPGLS